MSDLGSLFDRLARTRGGHCALRWVPFDGPVTSWTYGELVRDVRRRGAALQHRGLRPGDRVLLLAENSPDFVLGWAAIVTAGATAVCLNARSSVPELRWYAGHCDPVGAVVTSALGDALGAAAPDLGFVLTGDTETSEADFVPPPPDPVRPACIQYTSGTTSRPKAVVWTHANCLWAGRVGAAHQGLRSDDVNLVHLPLFHTNALSYSLLSTWWAGGTVVVQPKFSASRFWPVALVHGCTWTAMVTFTLRALAAHEPPADHAFRGFGHSWCTPRGAGPGGVGTLGWFGMTETVSHPVVGGLAFTDRPGSMGRPAPEYAVRVVSEAGDPVGPGEVGTLLVRGEPGVSLFAGYLGDANATAAAYTQDGWFRTGDRVCRDEGGTLTFVERDADVLKVGGENVGAPEIERILRRVPGVRDAAVVGRPDAMLGEVPVAFIVPTRPDDVGLAARIDSACDQELAAFKRPREIRVMADLPRATLGKLGKAALRRLAAADG